MATMDVFVVNVSLHSIGVGFGGEKLSNVSWVLSAYAPRGMNRDMTESSLQVVRVHGFLRRQTRAPGSQR